MWIRVDAVKAYNMKDARKLETRRTELAGKEHWLVTATFVDSAKASPDDTLADGTEILSSIDLFSGSDEMEANRFFDLVMKNLFAERVLDVSDRQARRLAMG